MPQVRIVHETEYTYLQPVQPTLHRLLLRPCSTHDLDVRSATLDVWPPPGRTRWAHDALGNLVCRVDWAGTRTQSLKIVSTLDVEHRPAQSGLPLDPAAEHHPVSYPAEERPDLAPSQRRHHPDPDGQVEGWARRFLAPGGPTRITEMLAGITRAIRADFKYEIREEEGTQQPTTTLRRRAGTCRDFALLMMEAARALGLAARFVAGYLYDDKAGEGGSLAGGGATHAWCAVYLPGAGWMEFDPTNGLIAGRNLIRVCWFRTPDQAVPVSGAYVGRPEDFGALRVRVEAAVTATPAP